MKQMVCISTPPAEERVPENPYLESVRSPRLAEDPLTPYLQVDLSQVEAAYRRFTSCFPLSSIHYAVKANPAPAIVRLLASLGCSFDVASPAEIDLCLDCGAPSERLSYGNTVKRSCDIGYAYRRGLRLFVFDCEEELEKLAANAPGANVFCRIATDSAGSSWPLSRKFGCSPEAAERMLASCPSRGLVPYGISFHVGSQQTDPSRWEAPLATVGSLFERLRARGVQLAMANLGGGFPARYNSPPPRLEAYGEAIGAAVERHLARFGAEVMLESGRGLVGDAGTILSRVVLVSRRDPAGPRWVYLDIGKFGGLAESMDESIQYQIDAPGVTGPKGPVVLAGPTCDSADILYERNHYMLPLALQEGDILEIRSAGAYTASYSSVGFNGFAPLATCFV